MVLGLVILLFVGRHFVEDTFEDRHIMRAFYIVELMVCYIKHFLYGTIFSRTSTLFSDLSMARLQAVSHPIDPR
jgi:hypothetical protein